MIVERAGAHASGPSTTIFLPPDMKKLLLYIFLAIAALPCTAASADGRYNSRMTQDGTLYFIMPYKLKDLSGVKRFVYDMTLLSWTDSVTVNFTFVSPSMLEPADLRLTSGDESLPCHSYSPLFIDIKKNNYEIRITSKFSSADIQRLLENAAPLFFRFKQGDEQKSAGYTSGAWAKDRTRLIDIFRLYQYRK